MDGLDLADPARAALRAQFCRGAELRQAEELELQALERELYARLHAVVAAKRELRQKWDSQHQRRPLAKLPPREEPPAEQAGTA